MANRIFYQADCDLNKLSGKTVAIIGYGSQGHAHALNLKESGVNVVVGLYEGSKSWAKAEEQGFEVFTAAEAAKKAKVAIVCAGLPGFYESEGFDREDLHMPEGHVRMIEAVQLPIPTRWSCCSAAARWKRRG